MVSTRARKCLKLRPHRLPLRLEPLETRLTPAQIQWDGGAGTFNWADAKNWVGDIVPGTSDDVVIESPFSGITVEVKNDVTVQSLNCAANLKLIAGTFSVTAVSNIVQLELAGATLSGAGAVNVSNSMVWTWGSLIDAGGELTLAATAMGHVDMPGSTPPALNRTMIVAGTLTFDGNVAVSFGSAGRLRTVPAGMIKATGTCELGIPFNGDAGTIDNQGAMTRSGPGATTVNVPLTSSGALTITEGELAIARGAEISGSISVVANAKCKFSGGKSTLTPTASVVGPGLTVAAFADLHVEIPSLTLESLDLLFGGGLAGAGNVTVTKHLTWEAGSGFAPGGVFTLAAAATADVSPVGFSSVALDRTLIVEGVMNVTVPTGSLGYMDFGNNALLRTMPGGTITTTGDFDFGFYGYSGSLGTIDNQGTLARQGPGTTTTYVSLTSSGTLNIPEGQFIARQNEKINGAVVIGPAAQWTIAAGDVTLAPSASVTGSGVSLTGGSLNVEVAAISLETLNISGGSLLGPGNVTVTKSLKWQGSGVTGSAIGTGCTVTVASSAIASLNLDVNGIGLGGTLVVAGSMTINGGYYGMEFGQTGLLRTLPGGVITAIGDVQFGNYDYYVVYGAIDNQGTFARMGSGTTKAYTSFTNSGQLNISANSLQLFRGLALNGGTVTTGPGASLDISVTGLGVSDVLHGSITNTNPFTSATAINVTSGTLEVFSADLGNKASVFANNFAHGKLTIVGSVQLVDASDNAPGANSEALYVDTLQVNSSSTIDLNGFHVYARKAQIDGAVVNGKIEVVPAPTVVLSSPGPIITGANPIPITLTFADSVNGLELSDFQATNAQVGNLKGSDASYSLDLIPQSFGSVSISLPAGSCLDAFGQANSASNPMSFTYLPKVSFVSTGQNVSEQGGFAVVEVNLSKASASDVTVSFAISGTATGSDYTMGASSVVIKAGSTSAFFSVTTHDDYIFESTETLVISVSAPTNAVPGDIAIHTINITDNEPYPQISFVRAVVNTTEGETVKLTAQLSVQSAFETKVNVVGSGLLISGNDVQLPSSATIMIPAMTKSADYSVEIVDDVMHEPAESATFSLVAPINAVLSTIPGTYSKCLVTVAANDAPIISFKTSQISTGEGGKAVVVWLSAFPAQPIGLKVPIQFLSSSTATNGDDYSVTGLSAGNVIFAAGSTQASFAITVVDDAVIEPREYIDLSLGNLAPDATAGLFSKHTISIHDNEKPQVQFSTIRHEVWEDDGTEGYLVNLRVSLVSPVGFDVPVGIELTGGVGPNTLPGIDFVLGATSATIKANSSFVDIPAFVTVKDNQSEFNDYLLFGIAKSSTYEIESINNQLVVFIRDNDTSVRFAGIGSAPTIGEADATHNLTLELVSQTNLPVTVTLENVSTTATSGKDFQALPSQITIPALKTSANVPIAIIDDLLVEPDEAVVVRIKSAKNAAVTSAGTASHELNNGRRQSLTIEDNETTLVTIPTGDRICDEDYGSTFFDIKLSKAATAALTVPLQRRSISTATVNDDFTYYYFNPSGTKVNNPSKITIAQGETSVRVHVSIINDVLLEYPEIVVFALGSPNLGDLGTDTQFALTINFDGNDVFPQFIVIGNGGTSPPIPGAGTIALDPPEWGGSPSSQPLGSGSGNEVIPGAGTVEIPNSPSEGSTLFADANGNRVYDFLDLNSNGLRDDGEPMEAVAVTGADGRGQMTLDSAYDRNSNGVIDETEAQFVASGGVFTSTGLARVIPSVSPMGYFVQSALTTLMVSLTERHGYTTQDAEQRVKQAFGLPDVPFNRFIAYEALAAGDPAAAPIYATMVKINTTAIQLANVLAGSGGGPPVALAGRLVFDDIADRIAQADSILDLSRLFIVEDIVDGVVVGNGIAIDPAIRAGVAEVIAAANQYVDSVPMTVDSAYLEALTKLQMVAHGGAADQLRLAAEGTTTIGQVVAAYTGAPLHNAVAAATAQSLFPPFLLAGDVRHIEGASGETWYEFSVQPDRASTRTISVDYQTYDLLATAIGTEADYQAISGTLTWLPGDTKAQLISVRVFGDARFESDENFAIRFSNVSHAVLTRTDVIGTIVNDEAFQYVAPDNAGPNVLNLRYSGLQVLLSRGDELVMDGVFSDPLTITLTGAADVEDYLTIEMVEEASQFVGLGKVEFHGGSGNGDIATVLDRIGRPVAHAISGSDQGSYSIDNWMLTYTGVESAFNEIAVGLDGPISAKEGQAVSLTTSVFDPQILAGATYAWNVVVGSMTVAYGTSDTVTFVPDDNGDFLVTMTAMTESGWVGTTTRSVHVINLPPTGATLTGPASIAVGQPAQFNVTGATDVPVDVAAGLKYSFDFTDDGIYDVIDVFSPSGSYVYATAGNYVVRAKITDKDGGFAETTASVSVVAPLATVSGIVINDGSIQRSRVTSLVVTFNQPPALPMNLVDAFQLVRQADNANVALNATVIGSTVTLTFVGGPVESKSLADGRYTLTVLAAQIANFDGNGDGTAGDDFVLVGNTTTNKLFRLFGDADGNGTVSAADFNAFRLVYGTNGPSIFDFDNDGQVSAADFNQFRLRYGATI